MATPAACGVAGVIPQRRNIGSAAPRADRVETALMLMARLPMTRDFSPSESGPIQRLAKMEGMFAATRIRAEFEGLKCRVMEAKEER